MGLFPTQHEADTLLALEKHYAGTDRFAFPSLGGRLNIPLISACKREEFFLDVARGRVKIGKGTFQGRARRSIVLARLDLEGPPHRNPDGEQFPCPHLHCYREGEGDKWAIPLPSIFSGTTDNFELLLKFMDYLNITRKPIFDKELFT